MGGKVIENPMGMKLGYSEISLPDSGKQSDLFKGIPDHFIACESHKDIVAVVPEGSVMLAENENSPRAICFDEHIFGLQFHPECSSALMDELSHYHGKTPVTLKGQKSSPDLTWCRQVLFNFFNAI